MDATANTQRRNIPRKTRRRVVGLSAIRIELKDALGNPQRVTASVVDLMDGGLGLTLTTPVKYGAIVVVRGRLDENHAADRITAVVRWCGGRADGTFRAGLEFLSFSSTPGPDKRPAVPAHSDTLDCYEVMQLSPKADSNTISRVYRLLAARYHPDNIETGNSEMFLRISDAYQILSDPTRRASYDACRRTSSKATDTRRAEPHVGHFRSSVGTLGGWDAALRAL